MSQASIVEEDKSKIVSHIVSQPNQSYLAGCGVPVTLSSLSSDIPPLC